MDIRKDAAACFVVNTDRKLASEIEKFGGAFGGELPGDFRTRQNGTALGAPKDENDGLAAWRCQLPQNRVGVGMLAAVETPTHGDGIVEDQDRHLRP